MNWIEEAIQPKPLPVPPAMQTLRYPRPAPRPVVLLRDAKGRVVFRVDYGSSGVGPACVYVQVRIVHYAGQTWKVIEKYPLSSFGKESSRDMRAALVRMYTELFEDRCEQTGIRCVNERRKEMKRWLSTTPPPTES